MKTINVFAAVTVTLLGASGCSDNTVQSGFDKSSPGKDGAIAAAKSCKCTVDSDCTGAGTNIFKGCSSTGSCAECKQDADCLSGPKKCNVTTGSCLQCAVDGDCATIGSNLKCNTTDGTCVACLTDDDCASVGIKKCDTTLGICKGCATDADCVGSPLSLTGKCDSTLGQCVRCEADADCVKPASSAQFCGPSKRCVECKGDSDCTSAAYKACDATTGTCSICVSDTECTGFTGSNLKCR